MNSRQFALPQILCSDTSDLEFESLIHSVGVSFFEVEGGAWRIPGADHWPGLEMGTGLSNWIRNLGTFFDEGA